MRAMLIILENDADYNEAMAAIDALIESTDPKDMARLRAQARLVKDYEQSRWPSSPPSVPDLLVYLMDQHGMSRKDLAPLLGGQSRVSEVLKGKKGLSIAMIQRLRERFDIPADLLIPRTGRRRVSPSGTTARQHAV
jgi:HTH-type transcriptional regulator / antitoxin HigA